MKTTSSLEQFARSRMAMVIVFLIALAGRRSLLVPSALGSQATHRAPDATPCTLHARQLGV